MKSEQVLKKSYVFEEKVSDPTRENPLKIGRKLKKNMAFFSCLQCFQKEEEEEITELDYAHRSLSDVPNEVFVYERTLEKIILDCNNIRDLPRQLFHCEGLRSLSVADNDVHVMPPALASLSRFAKFT